MLLPCDQDHVVLVVDFVKDGHRHFQDLVPGPVIVGANGFVQVTLTQC